MPGVLQQRAAGGAGGGPVHLEHPHASQTVRHNAWPIVHVHVLYVQVLRVGLQLFGGTVVHVECMSKYEGVATNNFLWGGHKVYCCLLTVVIGHDAKPICWR